MKNEPPTLQQVLKELQENLDTHIRMQASWALIMKARYDALIKTGFEPKQALEIVKTRGIIM